MRLAEAIEQFITHRKAKNLQAHTIRVYTMWFEIWQRWRASRQLDKQLSAVSADELCQFMAYLANEYEASARSPHHEWSASGRLGDYSLLSAWRTLRTLWRYLADEHRLSADQADYFPRRVPRPQVEGGTRPAYSDELINQLVTACAAPECPEQEARNRAIVLLLVESGMRAGELCGLRVSEIDQGLRQARIKGKGRRWGYVFWGSRAAHALAEYLRHRPDTDHDTLFCSVQARTRGKPMTYNALRCMFRRLEQRANVELIPGARIHTFRRTFARRADDADLPLQDIQRLMRHREPRTTMGYLEGNPAKLRRTHDKVYD